MTPSGLESTTTELVNKHWTSWPKWPYDWAELWVLIWTVHLTVCSCNVTYAFQIESTLYICLNVKEFLSQNRRDIWSLSDCKATRAQNRRVSKQTLNQLVKMIIWLSCILSTYKYGAFDSIFLSCHVRVSEWIHTLYLPECQETPCSNQGRYLKFKWLQRESSPQTLNL